MTVEERAKPGQRRGLEPGQELSASPKDFGPTLQDRIAFYQRTGWFDESWYLGKYPEAASTGLDPLLHYLEHGARLGIGPNRLLDELKDIGPRPSATMAPDAAGDQSAYVQDEIDLLAGSGLFDAQYYLENNPDVAANGIDPLRHFCTHGWRELRKPRPGFDVWWYWVTYLDPAREAINPLVHYALVGRDAGHAGHPDPYAPGLGHAYQPGTSIRRICLFAGYDPHGIVDDYVVAFLRELSLFADVHYLADCVMEDGELDKLRPFTLSRQAYRHGAYDFGSWSALAGEHVGWNVIEQYDELILANDSSYLLGGLGPVFAKMDGKACDWWGMQATKGVASTRHIGSNQFPQRIPMAEVKAHLVDGYEEDYRYDFLVGSYFLVYRRPVTGDAGFRRLVDAVRPQESKLSIIQKYEIGITHYLIGRQFAFDTFIDHLYPFHPIYTSYHFDLIQEGYPFLKRYFISQNHYDVPGLADWKRMVVDLVPDAPVDMMERNLLRVSDHDLLTRSFAITKLDNGEVFVPRLLDREEFIKADLSTPKFDHWWAFPADAASGQLIGNLRALFEEVRSDPSVKKIVLTRKKKLLVEGANTVVVPLRSLEGQNHLLRSRQIFVTHQPSRDVLFPVSPRLHNLINLWHGMPMGRLENRTAREDHKPLAMEADLARCTSMLSSSNIGSIAMTSALYPLNYNNVWCTGLPRNDFIVCPFAQLPADLRVESGRLENLLAGRRLVLLEPTFSTGRDDAGHRFTTQEADIVHAWLRNNNAVLGVREHAADPARTCYDSLRGPDTIHLSERAFPDTEVLYRQAIALVTGYSGAFVDFMLTDRPMVCIDYGHDAHADDGRGLFHDLEHVFPGPVCRDFPQFMDALDRAWFDPDPFDRSGYAWKRRLFHEFLDDANAWRVARRVRQQYVRVETETGRRM